MYFPSFIDTQSVTSIKILGFLSVLISSATTALNAFGNGVALIPNTVFFDIITLVIALLT